MDEFNIDLFTVVSLLLFLFLRLIFDERYLLIIIVVSCGVVVFAFIRSKPRIVKTNLRWTLLGIAGSVAVLVLIIQFELLIRRTWAAGSLIQNNLILTVIIKIAEQFSYTSLPEEIIFRGFVWGYMRRKGCAENKIVWAQGIMFWLTHFSRIATPFSFFVFIPIQTFIYSQLTLRTKQVFPAVISHTVFNVVGSMLRLATF